MAQTKARVRKMAAEGLKTFFQPPNGSERRIGVKLVKPKGAAGKWGSRNHRRPDVIGPEQRPCGRYADSRRHLSC